jgi:hypothetical protein
MPTLFSFINFHVACDLRWNLAEAIKTDPAWRE